MVSVAGTNEVEGREDVFQRIFTYSWDPGLILDPERDRIVEANRKALGFLGYRREELLEMPLSGVHPNETERLRAFQSSVLEEGEGWTRRVLCRTKEGGEVVAEVSASRVVLAGRPHVVAWLRDLGGRGDDEGSAHRGSPAVRGHGAMAAWEEGEPVSGNGHPPAADGLMAQLEASLSESDPDLLRAVALLAVLGTKGGSREAPGGTGGDGGVSRSGRPGAKREVRFQIQEEERTVKIADSSIQLGSRELALLRELEAHRGSVVSRRFLLDRVWGRDSEDDTVLVSAVHRLRAKLDPVLPVSAEEIIVTVRGVGYRLDGKTT